MAIRNNALWNCKNPHQGKYKRVLTICSAGLLRSPTIAWYIQSVSDYNCRAAGMHDYALVPVDEVLVEWADLIICADQDKYNLLLSTYPEFVQNKKVLNFNIPDIFEYKNPELIEIIKVQCESQGVFSAES